MVALACAMRTPVDPQSEIKGTVYGIEGIGPRFLQDRRPWVDLSTVGEDEAEAIPGRPGPGGLWMTTGDSPPSLTYFYVMGVARDYPRAHLGRQGAHGGRDGKLGPRSDPHSGLHRSIRA